MRAAATRRLWARRLVRVGWFVAPAFDAIGKAVRSGPFWGAVFWFTLIAGFVLFFAVMMMSIARSSEPISNEELIELAKDPCLKEAAIRFSVNGPITSAHVEWARSECDSKRQRQEQLKVLK